jgi:hypothetical protein
MTQQQAILRSSKCVAGTALGVLGMFILYQDTAETVNRFSQVLGSCDVLGRVPAVILAISNVLQAYASDQCFLQNLFQHMLVWSWPLLLVMLGTVLSRDGLTEAANASRQK